VFGASPPARAFLVARYIQAHSKQTPLIVICPNDDEALELQANLESLASTIADSPLQICYFPTWEQSPFSTITPSMKTRFERLAVLSSLIQKNFPNVIITTLIALSQATLPRKAFEENSTTYEMDQTVTSREDIVARLNEAGYLRMEPVEDVGSYAVRGDIIDVFPPNSPHPFRIELFGDLIENIRGFDPSTQRTHPTQSPGTIDSSVKNKVVIPPAREVLIQASTSPLLRENVKTRSDDLGIPRATRDPILSAIRSGIYSDHSDTWSPFAYLNPETLWDYVPPSSVVIWDDELSCSQAWDQFFVEQRKMAEQAPESGIIAPTVDSLFLWNDSLHKRVQDKSRVYLDRIELAQLEAVGKHSSEDDLSQVEHKEKDRPISARHRVFVKSNSDLLHGNRHSLGELESQIRLWVKQGFQVLALASTQSQLQRIKFLLDERNISCRTEGLLQVPGVYLKLGSISEGFRWPSEGLVLLSEEEILGSHNVKSKRKHSSKSLSSAKEWSGLQVLSDLSVGDTVVHVDHGIGRYQGITRLDLTGAPSDFLLLEYANKDKLYLPVYRLNVIQKYLGGSEEVALDRLGSQQFLKTKDKVREAVKKLAIDLIHLYAERKVRPGIQFSAPDSSFREFEAKFPFDETPDQLKAIDAVLTDLESGRVMDRLVCGDVGYGKTEVAIRAAFKAVSDGKQVALLVPTTILAQQHELSFKARLKDYPLIIESVSRFKSSKEQRVILEALAKGRVDIIIGTHRLLSKDIHFHDLGLVIVDEEHRFGVEHKERLKTLKVNTHVLTLTATPIPRTLHMSLSGLRDISLINTPPVDRLPIRTFVSKYDEALIKKAIEFELGRGGQVFFLHNRVQTIHDVAQRIRELVPSAIVVVGHGQMPENELEDKMATFYKRQANVLVCTTIVESGLDVPTANTMIISRADTLGLAQLYQLRGRVGRGGQRAYAYLLIPAEGAVTDEAKKRLEVIQRFVDLGSGFSIASHDLEIRGGGDILGPQQSGNIAAVGFDLYTELLEEAIHEIQGKPTLAEDAHREPEIKTPFPAFLSEEYVPEVHQRLSLYRRFSAASGDPEVDRLEEELRDRYGDLPAEAQNLLWLIRIKILLKQMGIDGLTVGPEKISLSPGPKSKLNPIRAIALISAHPHQYQLTPDSRLVAKLPTGSLRDLLFGLEKLFNDFSG
jgi:transcription-repair coupling factor (superfamily II helicase)